MARNGIIRQIYDGLAINRKPSLHLELFNVQERSCVYCGMPFATLEEYRELCGNDHIIDRNSILPTRDHVTPQCDWPEGGRRNIVLACAYCNNLKGDFRAGVFIRRSLKGVVSPILIKTLKFIDYPFIAELLHDVQDRPVIKMPPERRPFMTLAERLRESPVIQDWIKKTETKDTSK